MDLEIRIKNLRRALIGLVDSQDIEELKQMLFLFCNISGATEREKRAMTYAVNVLIDELKIDPNVD